jgi:hypothetical protein
MECGIYDHRVDDGIRIDDDQDDGLFVVVLKSGLILMDELQH